MTPLMLACDEELADNMEYLLDLLKIKVNAKKVDDQTALDIANQNGHFGIVDLIVSVLMNENEWIRNL